MNYKLHVNIYQAKEIPVSKMKVGEIGKIVKWADNQINYVGHWVLRCHKHLVSLTNPQYVWVEHLTELSGDFMVRLLDESEEIILEGVKNE